MTKRRSNLSFFPRGGLIFIVFLAAAIPGCKKTPPAPLPPQTRPLPKKIEPVAAVPPAAPVKSVQSAPSSARKVTATSPVLKQMSAAKRLTAPFSVNLDFTKRRDPFRPFVQVPTPQHAAVGKSSKVRVRDPLPIQSFETEKFKVSGIVTGLKENSALVIDPNGKGYVVKEGMLMGSNDGHVKRVTNSTVEIEESFRDDNGRVRKRLVKLTLLRKK